MRLLLFTVWAAFLATQCSGAQDSAASKKTSTHKTATKVTAAKTTPAPAKPAPKPIVQAKAAPKTTATKSTTAKASFAKTMPAAAAHRPVATASKPATVAARHTVAPPPRPYRQQAPTAERYKEIQQALVDKGYFSGPADGNWGNGSVDALKRFQRDESLTDDGKIGSLSLIALGLGPKRVATLEPVPEKPVQQ